MTAMPPLLMIAEGRRRRLRKAPVIRPKEFELHVPSRLCCGAGAPRTGFGGIPQTGRSATSARPRS
jgi:hypothetical protein